MAGENTKGQRQTKAASTPKEKKPLPIPLRVLVRLIAVCLTCVMILVAVLVVVYRDTVSLDGVVRYIVYRDLERDEEGQATAFNFSSTAGDAYAVAGSDLLVCSNNTLQLYSVSGKQLLEESVKISNPVVEWEGNTALAYDLGGHDLYVIRDREIVFTYSSDSRYNILDAHLNQNGYLSVVEEAAGYKASVTVYNANYDHILRENISSKFVTGARVSPDNSELAVLTIGQEDASFVNYLEVYECSSGEKLMGLNLGSSTVLDCYWTGDLLRLQQENGVTLVRSSQVVGTWSDSTQYLQSYGLEGVDYTVELMGRYKAGSVGQLMVINDDGEEYASRAIKEEVLSLSVTERYIAVLTANRLLILTSDLEEYATIPNSGDAQVLMREDGSAMLIGNGMAHLYVP
jgi:hypothetical protein